MIAAGLQALLSHWWRHPFQLVTLMLGLATATALWSGVQAINAEARASYDRAAQTLAGPARDTLARRDGEPIAQETYIALRRAGWAVSPLLEGRLDLDGTSLRIIGVDPFTLPAEDLPEELGQSGVDLSFLTPPGQLVVDQDTADRLEGTDLPPRITGRNVPPNAAYVDIGTAQRLLGRNGELSRLVVTGPSDLTAPPLEEVAPDLVREAPETGGGEIARLTDSFHLNLTAFGLLSFAVGLFIVRGAIGLAFEQRRPVFRTLRALGIGRGVLLGLLSAELLVLALIAGTLGVALGWLIATMLLPDVAATLRGLYGADVEGTLSLRPVWWLAGIAIAVLGTAIAAAGSLVQVARLPLLAPAQPRAWARASAATMRWQAVGAVLLAVTGLLVGWVGSGLVSSFLLLGSLLVAAALMLPIFLHAVLAGLARVTRGPLAEWFWADTRQQLPGLSLALMALLLALAANIGVGTMVQSFRLTFTGWLDQRLAAELYVTTETDAEGRRLQEFLAPRVDAVLPIRSADGEIAGRPVEFYGFAHDVIYTDHWPLIDQSPDVWTRVSSGQAVLVNEQLARRADLWPGDEIALPDGENVPVAGVYSDYGNPNAQAMIGLDRFDALFPGIPRRQFALRLDEGRVEKLTRALVTEFGLPPGNISDQASVKQFSLAIFERTFAVTSALNVLTLGVAGFAILTSLMTLATMRQPQLAPVWALGLTRARLARLELLRAALLAALTFVAALPVGLMLAWILLQVVNVEAFGWKLPLHFFPRDWLVLAGLSLLAALLAGLAPARRLVRMPPSDLLKVFANER
ncbi:putative ABC transport system permease protein [Palleronia aestuarii]|uniref:Putative ABC transport system permease protein n=1 Tax=Palleronia aestuarii TaxID=568105 RepID=A0A2W7N9I1_9RHOB|nr:FtsX-like permease family protein [Palleronia aestuarii]PZX16313.1 putative ABC transport system permease protein [Palleronia aestuarii]